MRLCRNRDGPPPDDLHEANLQICARPFLNLFPTSHHQRRCLTNSPQHGYFEDARREILSFAEFSKLSLFEELELLLHRFLLAKLSQGLLDVRAAITSTTLAFTIQVLEY